METQQEESIRFVQAQGDVVCLECQRQAMRRYGDFRYYLGLAVGIFAGAYITSYLLKGQ